MIHSAVHIADNIADIRSSHNDSKYTHNENSNNAVLTAVNTVCFGFMIL
jgi:hypothetical protein